MKCLAAIFALLCALSARAQYQTTLTWLPSADTNVIGYKIYYWSTNSATNCVDVGNVTTYTVTGLAANTTYFFAAKCYDVVHEFSEFSNVLSYTTALQLNLKSWTAINLPALYSTDMTTWTPTNFVYVLPGATNPSGFFKFGAPQIGRTYNQP